VGYTFISGALEAWIADEAPDRDLGRVYLRGEQADYIGSFIGIPRSSQESGVAGQRSSF
jgi:DHA3 family tetracycline resistance protein-like MFS transporter